MPLSTVFRLVAMLCAVLAAQPAVAGPWPREQGKTFVSFSAEQDRDGNRQVSIYGERGLTPRLTAGVEIDHGDPGDSSAIFWLQHSIDDGSGPNRMTMSGGIGAVTRDHHLWPVAQLGAAWGRGFETPWHGAWVAVESRFKIVFMGAVEMTPSDTGAAYSPYLTPETTSKLDLTLGLKPWENWSFVNQLRLEDRDDTGFSTRLATSIVRDFGGPMRAEFGVVAPISGPGEMTAKFGTWFEF